MTYDFKKYLHVERLGTEEVEGILNGVCHIFPKLDGSNCCVWADSEGNIHCGSRNRELQLTKDNAGFMEYILNDDSVEVEYLRDWCVYHPNYIVYGEWLGTKNQIRNYKEIKFWVFDIYSRNEGTYVTFEALKHMFAEYPYIIEPMDVLVNPTAEQLQEYVDTNHYNLPESTLGEGIVVKNYCFRNQWNRYEVAKIVRDEYKQNKAVSKKTKIQLEGIEKEIVAEYITGALVEKTKYKVLEALEEDKWAIDNKHMGMILNMVWYDFINEDIYHAIKKYKNPIINFKVLNSLCNSAVRGYLGL